MDGIMRGRKILLRDLNAHLICVLCGGYYIDATSISECLHTFCRSCIVKYLKSSRFCPICDVQLHKDPLLSLSADKTLQRLVYKMVPGLYSSEMQRRRNFYHSCDVSAVSSASSTEDADVSSCDAADAQLMDAASANANGTTTVFYSPDDSISLSLEYYNSDKEADDETDVNCCLKKVGPPRRYLKCPAALKMHLLKKFLRTKYGLAPDHKVDIIYADECLPDDFSLMDVAYIFMWNRANPMRFSYRILEWSTVKVPASFGNTGSATSPQPALTSDSPPDKARQPPSNHTTEKESSSRGRRIQDDRRRIRESDSETEIKCRQKPKQEPKKRARREPSIKKSRANKKNTLKKKVNNFLRSTTPVEQTPLDAPEESIDSLLTKETDIKESIQDKIEACIQDIDQDIDNDISMELLEDQIEEEIVDEDEVVPMEVEDNKQTNSSGETHELDDSTTVDDKMREDFVLRDKQNDNDDLEEDDEYRLRISASEEDCAQEESPATVDLEEESSSKIQVSESSRSKDRKESLKRNGEFRVKRKNKKAKHHHHHRHHDRRRDHHPPAATILPSPDTKDIMKLKVKLTTVKPDEAKHHQKYSSHSPNRHHNSKHKISYHVISDDNEPVNSNSNGISDGDVEKSIKSSAVVENEAKSNDLPCKKPCEERLSSEEKPKSNPILINSSTETNSSHTNGGNSNNKTITLNSNLSNKEKLLQMRSIRHKPAVENNSQNFKSLNNNNNNNNNVKNNDLDVVEIEEIKTSNSTILIPPSSITVSKITAAEKRKMDEEKLLKMSGKGNNEIDSKRPSLEIMLVEAPPQTKNAPVKHSQDDKKQDDKVKASNSSKINSSAIPIVKIQKTHNLQQNGRQSLLTIAQKLNSSKTLNNKTSSIGVNKSSQITPNNKETKCKQTPSSGSDDLKALQDSNGSPLNKSKSPGSLDSGALDLSDKSSRKGSSPASSISSDGCPSPNSNFYSLLQQQTADRVAGHQPQSGRSPANNTSMSQASVSSKNCPELGVNVFPAGMRNLMTLSDTASQIRDMMAARDTSDRFQQLARSHNFQQKRSPQHFHSESPPAAIKLPQSMLSPSTRAVLASSSSAHLKIPVPRALPINNKMAVNRNGSGPIPDLNEVTINRNRGTVTLNSYPNRNGMVSKPGPNQAVRQIPNPSIVSFRQNQMKNMSSAMAVRPFSPPKKVTVNGRTHVMPPPPPAIPLASLRRMESMTRNIEKVAAGLQVKAAVEAGFSVQ